MQHYPTNITKLLYSIDNNPWFCGSWLKLCKLSLCNPWNCLTRIVCFWWLLVLWLLTRNQISKVSFVCVCVCLFYMVLCTMIGVLLVTLLLKTSNLVSLGLPTFVWNRWKKLSMFKDLNHFTKGDTLCLISSLIQWQTPSMRIFHSALQEVGNGRHFVFSNSNGKQL